jgi:uncharacterized protein YhfF
VSGFHPARTDATDAFFNAFKADAGVDGDAYTVAALGDSEKAADAGLEAVLAGIKRATAAPVAGYAADGGRLPQTGDHAVVVDGRNKPRCVWRVTAAAVKPLSAVDDDFAWDDGATTRPEWLAARRAGDTDPDTLFLRFTIVWPRLFSDDWKGPRPA